MSAAAPVVRHFTASAFVTHDGRALLLLHSRKRIWLPPGGHVEPDEPPDHAAVREVWEETGLRIVITSGRVPADTDHAAPRPEACLEIEVEPGHVHLDLVYFARPAPGSDPDRLRPNEEAADLRWWSPEDLRRGGGGELQARTGLGGDLPPDVATLALLALRTAAR